MRASALLLLLPLLFPALQGASTVPIENAYVKVIDALQDPHVVGPMHEHMVNRVMIYLNECTLKIVHEGGRVENQHWKPGQVAWSPAGGRHTSENTGSGVCHLVEIEVKPGSGRKVVAVGEFDPAVRDPEHYKVELENAEVRVLRAKFEPHYQGVLHEHTRDRVTVYLTDSEIKVTPEGGVPSVSRQKAGNIGWSTPARHAEYNAADRLFEVISVEIKAR